MITHKTLRLLFGGLTTAGQTPVITELVVGVGGAASIVVDYVPGYVSVVVNDIELTEGVDYTATTGSGITFTPPLNEGDEVVITAQTAAYASLASFLTSDTHDFDDGSGPVPAHRHIGPTETLGGWVADTAYVDPQTTVTANSVVFGYAVVLGNSSIEGGSRVRGFSRVLTSTLLDTFLEDSAFVENSILESCVVNGRAFLRGVDGSDSDFGEFCSLRGGYFVIQHAMIHDTASIIGDGSIIGDVVNRAQVLGAATISGTPAIRGYVIISGVANIHGAVVLENIGGTDPLIIDNNTRLLQSATVTGPSLIIDNVALLGNAFVESSELSGNTRVFDDAVVEPGVILPNPDENAPYFTADPTSPHNQIGTDTVVPGESDDPDSGVGSIDGEPNEDDD